MTHICEHKGCGRLVPDGGGRYVRVWSDLVELDRVWAYFCPEHRPKEGTT